MSIPNPNPNIRDLEQLDNYTWSSNKIAKEISEASSLVKIDDTTASSTKVFSSSKTTNLINAKQDSLTKGTITNTDLNTLNANGFYYLAGVSTDKNAPVTNCYGMLEVMNSNIIVQRITQVGPSGIGVNMYERLYINNAWTAWKHYTRTFT